jgi:hypothetical protein
VQFGAIILEAFFLYVAVCNLMSFSFKDIVTVECDVDINPLKLSGHYIYRQFNVQQFYFLPTRVFMYSAWIPEQTAIISLYNIDWFL